MKFPRKTICLFIGLASIAAVFTSCLTEEPPIPTRLEFIFDLDSVGEEITTTEDTLEITQVKMLVEKFNLGTPSGDTLQTQTRVLIMIFDRSSIGEGELVVAGNIGFSEFDTFNGFQLFVRPLRSDDNVNDETLFEDGEGYSLAIRGLYNGEVFLYRSKINYDRAYDFSPVELTPDKETLVLNLKGDMRDIFMDNETNTIISPIDENNADRISQRMRESLTFEAHSEQSLPFNR